MADTGITKKDLLSVSGSTLVENLDILARELTSTNQIDGASGKRLGSCVEALGDKRLMQHSRPDVRLLTACCLSDVLRIYAPETPFDNPQLLVIFDLFVTQLRGTADPAGGVSFQRYYYLLERLAMIQAFVLLIDLNTDDLMRQLFETLFDSIRDVPAQHSIRVENHVLDILANVIEELDNVPNMILGVILEQLTANLEKPAAYRFARKLLHRCKGELHRPINEYMQSYLPLEATADDWPKLLVELTSVSLQLVSSVLPQLNEVTASEDVQVRLLGVELLTNLLGLPKDKDPDGAGWSIDGEQVLQEFPQFLPLLLSKFCDISVEVRCLAVERGVRLVQQDVLTTELLKALAERVIDPAEEVRRAVVIGVSDACATQLNPFGGLLGELAKRMFDKKLSVRSLTRAKLCSLYCRHLTASPPEADGDTWTAPGALADVPQKLLQCYGAEASRDLESRLEIETLLTTKLLPSAPEQRLAALSVAHRAFGSPQRTAFRALLRSKRNAQHQFACWLRLQANIKEHGKSSSTKELLKAAKAELAELVGAMSRDMPDPVKAKEVWDQLMQTKDQRIAKNLVILSSPTSTFTEATGAIDDLRSRMGQRLTAAQLPILHDISARPAMLLFCKDDASRVLERLCAGFEGKALFQTMAGRFCAELELLADVASIFPEVLTDAADTCAQALQRVCEQPAGEVRHALLQLLLRTVHAASLPLGCAPPGARKVLVSVCCQICCGKDAGLGKLAAQCLSTKLLVTALRERTFSTLIAKLTPAISGSAGPVQHCALSVLGALAKRAPEALGKDVESLLAAVKKCVTQTSGGTSGSQLRMRCESQCLAIKVLANEAIGSAGPASSANGDSAGKTDKAGTDKAKENADKVMLARHKMLAEFLLRLLQESGVLGAAANATAVEKGQLRLAAVCGLLKMARVQPFQSDALFGARGWHCLALCMQDPEFAVRTAMAKKLQAELMRPFSASKQELKLGAPEPFLATRKAGLPPHYLVVLALAGPDLEKAHVQSARAMLVTSMQRWRAAATRFKDPRLMPEVQLPWLLHTLAHHPNFKAEEASGDFQSTQRCIDLFVSAVLQGASEFDLLRQMLGRVKMSVDRLSPDGHEVHVVADIAREILHCRGKERKWTQAIVPQELTTPAALFYRPTERTVSQIVDYLPRGFKLLEGIGKGGGLGGTKRTASSPLATLRRIQATVSYDESDDEAADCGDAEPPPQGKGQRPKVSPRSKKHSKVQSARVSQKTGENKKPEKLIGRKTRARA